jgi:hypothetical protein
MTQLEILKLALDGTERKIRSAADRVRFHATERSLKELRASIEEHDCIAELIENEKHPSAATPECISIPISIGGELIDTVNVPKN